MIITDKYNWKHNNNYVQQTLLCQIAELIEAKFKLGDFTKFEIKIKLEAIEPEYK